MKRTLRKCAIAAVPVLVMALLAACKLNVTTELYSTDLRDVMANGAELSAPTTLAFQVPSIDDCDEHAVKIGEIMAGVLKEFSPRGCESAQMDSFLLADTQIPIVTSAERWLEADALFGIMLLSRHDPDHIGVAIILDSRKYDVVTSRMKDKFHQTVDLADSRVTLILNNDERNAVTFAVRDVFVNSEPAYGEHEYTLERRHKANIRLSDVAKAYLAREGMAGGFTLRKSVGAGE